jgi:hypothetical protein
MRNTRRLQRRDGRERAEERVAVVGAAAAVQTPVIKHRLPWAESCAPSVELGLLVVVPVQEHGSLCAPCSRGFCVQQRCSFGQGDDLGDKTFDAALPRPCGQQIDGAPHVARRLPARVEGRRLVGNADVVAQGGHDGPIPAVGDESLHVCRHRPGHA